MDDLISIIVPIYKIEDYLEKCVNSISDQTYRNLEIILVDDGSPDQCGEICERMKEKDSRIKVLHKVNGGLSDARNAGIKAANGKYIAFVDGDDYVHKDYIKNMYKAIIEENADVSLCSFTVIEGNHVLKVEKVSDKKCSMDGSELLKKVLTDTGYKYVVAWNKLYKSELFQKHLFAKGKIYEDEYINFELFWDVKKVTLIPDDLYYYIRRQGSIQGSSMTWDKILTKQEIHHKRIAFYREKKADDLMQRSHQMYCNWLVNTVYRNSNLLNRERMSILQKEFRKYCKRVCASKGERLQNIIAAINLKLAGKIKAIYKEREKK